ncbi:MAG: cytochrome c oxidase assembly protein [Legionellaceae bacterium]|nr:cytochrome c oxidase assembly protein [Legionellaceae bacterium]
MSKKYAKNARTVVLLGLLVLGMFGFGFALVPIYKSMCQVLGINGKPAMLVADYDESTAKIALDRQIQVQFVATNNGNVSWKFYPKTQKVTVHPGKVAHLAFYAENTTDHMMTVQAIPSVTPGIAAKYIKKTECFCFTRQTLGPHEAMDMPLLFFVDPDLPKKIITITLSYTLFDVTDKV